MRITFFEDYTTIEEHLEKGNIPLQTINKKQLINILNYLNFKGHPVVINLRHKNYGNILSISAYPLACDEEKVWCAWTEKPLALNIETSFEFQSLIIDRGASVIVAKTDAVEINKEGIVLSLPEQCEVALLRRAKRYHCVGVTVEMYQNGAAFCGWLLDFNGVAFRIVVTAYPSKDFRLLRQEIPVYVIFKRGGEIIYSGECNIIKQSHGKQERVFVLSQVYNNFNFEEEKFKRKGYILKPQPVAVFMHPLTNKLIRIEIEEIASSWFTVLEDEETSVLFPGLIIPELKIEITYSQSISCRVQVLNKITEPEYQKRLVKWRVLILDIPSEDQIKLASLLSRADDKRSYICPTLDLEALFDFFFLSGFIYPDKYLSLLPHKEKFIETYKKLYLEAPSIAKHFIYQEKGQILGHVSMLRFYENTWLVHHHASIKRHFAGIAVLKQVSHYIADFCSFPSSHMDFVMCYFQPQKKFPNRVFGGIASELNNPKMCSIDTFAYLDFDLQKYNAMKKGLADLLTETSIMETTVEDLVELKGFYEYISGGLMIDALDLRPEMLHVDTLQQEYESYGFKRERKLFSIKKHGYLQAIVMLIRSNVGLNMSNLTNCFHVFITRPEFSPEELFDCLYHISHRFGEIQIPVLIFPVMYAKEHEFAYNREYNLWCFDTIHKERFLKYMEQLFLWISKYEKQNY